MKGLVLLAVLLIASCTLKAEKTGTKVFIMEIRDEINAPMKRYVKVALEAAEKSQADIVIIDMDTFGGVLTDAKEIAEMILAFKKPVWVYINSDAASAGALISIACDRIYMAPSATIGAATVVNGSDGTAAPDKYQSYMRSIMRSTAEENHRDPQIAEGMVDENIEIPGIKEAGKIITFTTSEALKYGFCDARVNSIEEILELNKITGYTTERFQLSTTEKIIAFFMNPVISGLLILLIIGGIYFEFQAPGIGLPLFVAITALVLYLVPYYLNGLAENWEILILITGILLIIAEVFIIPGFGVAGISGISLTLMALILIMLNNDYFNFDLVGTGDVLAASLAALGGILGAVLLLMFAGRKITHTNAFRRMALLDTQSKEHGFTANFVPEIEIGTIALTQTVLRPGGKVIIEGKVYDAFSRGEYIEPNESVEVIGVEASTLKVRRRI
jgi:membrane-bound serine protease (ClpP class)